MAVDASLNLVSCSYFTGVFIHISNTYVALFLKQKHSSSRIKFGWFVGINSVCQMPKYKRECKWLALSSYSRHFNYHIISIYLLLSGSFILVLLINHKVLTESQGRRGSCCRSATISSTHSRTAIDWWVCYCICSNNSIGSQFKWRKCIVFIFYFQFSKILDS